MTTTYKILAASYTRSVFSLSFTPGSSGLKLEASTPVVYKPSWLEAIPSGPRHFMAIAEQEDGEAFLLEFDDVLKEGKVVDHRKLGERDPCHITFIHNDDEILSATANYSSGSVTFMPISSTRFADESKCSSVTFSYDPSTSPKKVLHRQEAAHAHQVVYIPEYKELLVPDLGGDKIWRLTQDSNGWSVKGSSDTDYGDGPRHVVFYDGYLYIVHELSCSLGVHSFPPLSSSTPPRHIQTVPSLSDPPSKEAQKAFGDDSIAAEIVLVRPSTDGDRPILYYTTRNIPGPEGDVITIFTIEEGGKVAKVSEVKTGLAHLRAISLSPDNKYLIAAGAVAGGVKVYERQGTSLKEVSHLAYGDGFDRLTGFVWA